MPASIGAKELLRRDTCTTALLISVSLPTGFRNFNANPCAPELIKTKDIEIESTHVLVKGFQPSLVWVLTWWEGPDMLGWEFEEDATVLDVVGII